MKNKLGLCGKVLPGVVLKIVNLDTEKLEPNQKGEIRLKSKSLMNGYYEKDSFFCFDSDGFLKTGDIGYYNTDECIYVVDRIKEMCKYKLWHIFPSSIEAVVLQHPAVKEAVVFGIPKDEDGIVPDACVVLIENCKIKKEEIEKFVGESVSDYEKLRGGIIFVESLPRTPHGNVMRNELYLTF